MQVVFLTTLLAPFSIALVSPGLPVFRSTFGTTDQGASLLLATILLPGVLLSPLVGLLTDRIGRRRVLVASLLGWGLAGGAVMLRPPYATVLALRLLQGTAFAGMALTTITIIGDAFDGVQRNAVLGVNTAVLSAGAAVYPLLGGALVTVSWSAPFAMYLLGVPAAVFAWAVLEEPAHERESRTLVYLGRVIRALSPREATALYGSALMIDFLLFGAVFTMLPFLLAGTYTLTPVLIGAVITIGEIASTAAAAANGWLARRFSDYRIIVIGFIATGVGLIGAWLARSPVQVAVATVGFGAGWGLVLPSIDAGVSDLVPSKFRAGALSLRGSASFAGRSAGPVMFAALAAGPGYAVLLLLAGVVAMGYALVVLALTAR